MDSLSPFCKEYVSSGKSLLYKAHVASQESLSAGINVVEAKSYLHGAMHQSCRERIWNVIKLLEANRFLSSTWLIRRGDRQRVNHPMHERNVPHERLGICILGFTPWKSDMREYLVFHS